MAAALSKRKAQEDDLSNPGQHDSLYFKTIRKDKKPAAKPETEQEKYVRLRQMRDRAFRGQSWEHMRNKKADLVLTIEPIPLSNKKQGQLKAGPLAVNATAAREWKAILDAEKAGIDHPAPSHAALQALSTLPNWRRISEQAQMGRWHNVLEQVNATPEGQKFLTDIESHFSIKPSANLNTASDADLHHFLAVTPKPTVSQAKMIAANPNASAATIEELLTSTNNSKTIINLLKNHPNLPPELKEKLFPAPIAAQPKQVEPETPRKDREKLARGNETPPEMLYKLASGDKEFIIRYNAAHNAKLTPELLAQLATSKDVHARSGVAGNPSTPPELLAQLARDPDDRVRDEVPENPNTPPELLALLAKDPNANVRWKIAQHARTSPELLVQLAGDKERDVRYYTALNPNTPPEAIAKLAGDPDEDIQHQVLKSSKLTPEILTALAGSRNDIIREEVADHQNTPPAVIEALAKDKNEQVRATAQLRLAWTKAVPLSKAEMVSKGFRGKESIDHIALAVDAALPANYYLNAKGANWIRYIYAMDTVNEFPPELFKVFNIHHIPIGNGKPLGWIGGKWNEKEKTLYVTEMQSDVLQRTQELRDPRLAQFAQYRSRLENRFDGWYYTFFNQAVREAKERGAEKIALPTAEYYVQQHPTAAGIAHVYEKVLPHYPHTNQGHWNIIDLSQPGIRMAAVGSLPALFEVEFLRS